MKKLILKLGLLWSSLSILTQLLTFKTFAAINDGAGGALAPNGTPIGGNGTSGGSSSSLSFTIPKLVGYNNLGDLISALVGLAYFVAGVAFFFMLIIGGIQWISAGGDAKALDSARKRITNAVIGLVIVVAAFAITVVVGQVFGISIANGFKFK